MTKYKLEYIWLDGYTPVPNLRGKTQIKEYERVSDASSSFRCGASTAARRMQAEGQQLRLRAEAGRASIPTARAPTARSSCAKS